MPISTSCWRRRLGRIGSVWVAAAKITLGITVGMLVGVIAPGAMAAFASPAHGSATAPAAHRESAAGDHSNAANSPTGSAPASSPVLAAVPVQQSSSSFAVTASSAGPSAFSQVNSKGKSGTVHAASLVRNDGSGAISVPGNCQSPQCELVELVLAAVIGAPTATPTTSPAPMTTTTIAAPRAPSRPSALSLTRATRTNRRAGSGTRPAISNPASTNRVPTVLEEPIQLATGGWGGVSLKAATNLRIPILFGAAVLLFVLLQALVDRRDPKMTRAPERGEDDSVGFS